MQLDSSHVPRSAQPAVVAELTCRPGESVKVLRTIGLQFCMVLKRRCAMARLVEYYNRL
jgi:hypothetical protein